MIDYNYIYNKDEICYCLLSSYNHPNVLIPIKCLIIDVKFGYGEAEYLVRIERFYDDIYFLKTYLYNMLFYTKFNTAHKVKLNLPNLNGLDDINSFLVEGVLTVVVPHLMCFSTKQDMMEAFNKLNFYFVSLHTYNLKLALTRSAYNGEFKLSGTKDFNERFKRFMSDKISEDDLDDFLQDIERTKSIFSETYKIKKRKFERKDLKKPIQ